MMKHKPELWSSAIRNSHHEGVILAGLRLGHTRLTHSYLPQGLHTLPHVSTVMKLIYQSTMFSIVLPFRTYVPSTVSPIPRHPTLCNNSEMVSNFFDC